MTSKERVYRTLRLERPDRVPTALGILSSAYLRHGERLVDVLKRYPLDINPCEPHVPELPPPCRKGTYVDEWGCVWRNLHDGIRGEVIEPAIRSWSDLASYRPPPAPKEGAPERFDRFPDAFHTCGAGSLFERLQFLRKTEQLLLDLADQPKELLQLRKMVTDYIHARIDDCLETPCDAVSFMDDWGSQRALLISPALWREFFKPCYKEFFARVHAGGRFVHFHSDGWIFDIIEDLVEIGVDALNSQVWCMGVEELGARFRGRITFWGELDRQWVVPHGSPEDIRRATRRMMEHLATPAGGLVGEAEVDGLTPLENVEAILTAWS